jgi:Protein of unknown function (DUF3048) N-terminal domain/Protein of unknown function (DUF3048) C-terminal domain
MRVPPGARRVTAVLAASAALALVAGCGHPEHDAAPPPSTTTTTVAPTTTTARPIPVCPLTHTPAPEGKVPQRAALAVKVENLPQARPQYGLDQADIVFEEPVEGGITRFIAVYQCQEADRIEPVRSARFVDPDILEPLGKILFAYSGAITPVVDVIDSSTSLLQDVGYNAAPSAYSVDFARVAPHNLQTSTRALYAAAKKLGYAVKKVPPPYFAYGRLPAGGKQVSAVHINFPLDVTSWTWGPQTGRWVRSYSDTGPAVQGDNVVISAANVVIMHVVEYPTPYVEDSTGAHEDQLVLTGSGPAWILRNGVELTGTWKRPSLSQPAIFEEADGTTITLTPGNTWEELVPDTSTVTVSGAGQAGGPPSG